MKSCENNGEKKIMWKCIVLKKKNLTVINELYKKAHVKKCKITHENESCKKKKIT